MSDEEQSLFSVDALQADYLKYRKRRKYIEKQLFHLTKEHELVKRLETNLKQSYDQAVEAERELHRYAKPTKKPITRDFACKCVECSADFTANWKGKKYCPKCTLKNARARAASRSRCLAMEG